MKILVIILLIRYVITLIDMLWYSDINKFSIKLLKSHRKDGLYIILFPLLFLSMIILAYYNVRKEKTER